MRERELQRPLHGGPVDRAVPRGGGVCGGIRLSEINREKNIQRVEYSALLTTRKLDWLASTYFQIRCDIG
eukprot:1944418-Pyramimonas_sp.AAC.1